MIYIEENTKMADVVFPTKPIIVSLKDYDDVSSADNLVMNGYPVVCITVSSHMTWMVIVVGNSMVKAFASLSIFYCQS